MSRTYRTHLEYQTYAHGRFWTWEEEKAFLDETGEPSWFTRGWSGHYFIDRKSRDRKPWDKPPRSWKRMNRQWERQQVRQAMIHERYENIPLFRKYDQWDWT